MVGCKHVHMFRDKVYQLILLFQGRSLEKRNSQWSEEHLHLGPKPI